MEFSGQEYRSGFPFPPPPDLPNPGIKPTSLASPALAGNFLTALPPGKPLWAIQTMIRKEVSPGTCRRTILQSPKDWCHFIAPGKSLPQERNHIRSFSMKMSTEKMHSLKVDNYVSFKVLAEDYSPEENLSDSSEKTIPKR